MNQDVNKIIDNLNAEWAQDMATSKRESLFLWRKLEFWKKKINS